MDEKRYIQRVQWAVLIGLSLLLVLIFAAWIIEATGREWRIAQKEFVQFLDEHPDSLFAETDQDFEKGIFQVDLPRLNRVDRCISCHHGLEDPRMENAPQPHRIHPGTFLADHPVRQYGCTICHGGQGRALTRVDAHGQAAETHWPQPLLEKPYIQASCGKCHLAIFSGFTEEPERVAGRSAQNAGGSTVGYAQDADGSTARFAQDAGGSTGGYAQNTDGSTARFAAGSYPVLEGMEVFQRGRYLFSREGCLGCHKARGVGGIVGPDLTEQGEKTKHEYSFQNIRGEQTISNWLMEHFRDPEMVSPGSQMLRIDLEEQDLEALATFVMGLSKPDIPFEYFTITTLNEFKGIREMMKGGSGYAYLCSACHGKNGEGKSYEEYETGVPAVGNRDFIRVASPELIRFTLEKGRSRRQMPSWAREISGVTDMEMDSITRYLEESGFLTNREVKVLIDDVLSVGRADPVAGEKRFEGYCQACHGTDGAGGVAVALNQPGFLDRAGDAFIVQTIVEGRGNTAMPGWGHLGTFELANLLSHIDSWDGSRRNFNRGQFTLPEPDTETGDLRYHFLCSRCHGDFGEGDTGPAVINSDFLAAASDRYLYETIAEGRVHTAMFGWSTDVYNEEQLDRQEIGDIIGFMREMAAAPLTYIYPGSNPGNAVNGSEIYAVRCAECHGDKGEGPIGPALNNQEFLNAASNGYILATITVGREGTAMPSWGYGWGYDRGHEREHDPGYDRGYERGHGDGKYPALSGQERQDLVAMIRAWQRIRIKF